MGYKLRLFFDIDDLKECNRNRKLNINNCMIDIQKHEVVNEKAVSQSNIDSKFGNRLLLIVTPITNDD